MLDIKNSIGVEWRTNSANKRARMYLFKCLKCINIAKSRKCYFKKHSGLCQSCSARITIKAAQKNNRKRPYEARYNNFLARTKNDNPKTDLTYEDYLEFTKINECHYCNIPINWEPYTKNTSGFFLDRKENEISHIKSNLVVCCELCNFTKRDEFSYDEFLIIGRAIELVKTKRIADSSFFGMRPPK